MNNRKLVNDFIWQGASNKNSKYVREAYLKEEPYQGVYGKSYK